MIANINNYYQEIMTQGVSHISEAGEDMAVAYQYNPRRIYLINRKMEFAWLVLDRNDLVLWDTSDVDFAQVDALDNSDNAHIMYARYGFNIGRFKNGLALVNWTLYPDGQYFADEDGYGMEDNGPTVVYAFINRQGRVVIPFQPMTSDQIRRFQGAPPKKRVAVLTGLGIHNELNRFNMVDQGLLQPGIVHQRIADLQQSYDVTVVTTCKDTCHEQAGQSAVVRLLSEQPEQQLVSLAAEAIRRADVTILVGCRSMLEPIRSLMQYVHPFSRLYVCRYNDGEGVLPRLHNVVRAFAYSTFEPLEEGILSVVDHLERFPLDD